MEKGQAELTENVFAIIFGVIILAAISVLAYNLYMNQLRNEIENNLEQLGTEVSNNILKLYETGRNSKYSPDSNMSARLANVDLNLPSQVSGRNYEIVLMEANPVWVQISNITIGGWVPTSVVTLPRAKVILRTIQSPIVTVEHEIPNIDANVQGNSENGLNSTLVYYRYDLNGIKRDTIVLGGYDIIINIESVR